MSRLFPLVKQLWGRVSAHAAEKIKINKQNRLFSLYWLCNSQMAKGGSVSKSRLMNNESKSSTQNILLKSVTSIEDEEIDIVRIISVLLSSWKILVIFVFISTSAATYYAFHATEVFKIGFAVSVQEEKSRVPSALSQLGGLAAMAGNFPYLAILAWSRYVATLAVWEHFFKSALMVKKISFCFLFEDLWNPRKSVVVSRKLPEDEPSEQRV